MEIRNWWQIIQCNYTFKLLSYSPNIPQKSFFFFLSHSSISINNYNFPGQGEQFMC